MGIPCVQTRSRAHTHTQRDCHLCKKEERFPAKEREKLTDRLGIRVHVLLARARVRFLIMRDIINLPLFDKVLIDLPRRVLDDFVDPPDVPHRLVPLFGRKDGVRLVLFDEGRGTDPDEEVDRGEHEFALPQLEHVAICE